MSEARSVAADRVPRRVPELRRCDDTDALQASGRDGLGPNGSIPAQAGSSRLGYVLRGAPLSEEGPYVRLTSKGNSIERPDSLAAEHVPRLSILPVISAPWNEGK